MLIIMLIVQIRSLVCPQHVVVSDWLWMAQQRSIACGR